MFLIFIRALFSSLLYLNCASCKCLSISFNDIDTSFFATSDLIRFHFIVFCLSSGRVGLMSRLPTTGFLIDEPVSTTEIEVKAKSSSTTTSADKIDDKAFFNASVESVHFEEGSKVKKIGKQAFHKCSS